MKNIITLLLFLISFIAFSQNIKRETLNEAGRFSEIVPEYPKFFNKILVYSSVNIITCCDGKTTSAQSINGDTLTREQKKILKEADPGSDILIEVKYAFKDPAQNPSSNGALQEMKFDLIVLPDKEAEFPGGRGEMVKYMREKVMGKLENPVDVRKISPAIVNFSVNEKGKIVDVKLFKASSDPKIDALFLEAIHKMPSWKPAENAKGKKVKQHFSLPVPLGGC